VSARRPPISYSPPLDPNFNTMERELMKGEEEGKGKGKEKEKQAETRRRGSKAHPLLLPLLPPISKATLSLESKE